MFRINLSAYRLLLLSAILLLGSVTAFAQTPVIPVTISNSYVGVTVYATGDNESGRCTIFNVLGDTSDSRDDQQDLMAWGQTEVMVESLTAPAPEGVPMWLTFQKGQETRLSAIWGETEHGAWSISPYIPTGEQCIKGVWMPIKPKEGEVAYVEVEQEVRILHDMVRFKWTVKNNDLMAHRVGIRFEGDTITEPTDSGVANQDNVVSVPGYPLVENCSLYPSTSMPASFEVYNSQTDPGRGVRVTLDGQNGATRPDMLGIDEWYNVSSLFWTYAADPTSYALKAIWDYEIIPPDQMITNNLGYGVFWKPVTVLPGKTRTIIHYVSNPGSNSVTNMPSVETPKYTASVEGPRTLKYSIDAVSGAEVLSPSTFRITAFLENLDRSSSLRNCTFTLVPPVGIALDASETGYTKSITEIPAKSDASVSWLVKANGNRTGILTYYVAVSASPMGSAIVKRTIHVPAVARQSLLYGWQQISVPFELTDTNPATALGLQPGSLRKIFRYDSNLPVSAPYYPYEEVVSMVPGEAYWLYLNTSDTATLAPGEFQPKQWDGYMGYEIPVHYGWNMVGNPYVYTVTMGELRFSTASYGTLTYDEATAKRLISRTLWWWNTSFNTWNWSTQRTAQFKPWQGYWIKVLDPTVQAIVITPASQIGAAVGGEATGGGGDDGGGPPSIP